MDINIQSTLDIKKYSGLSSPNISKKALHCQSNHLPCSPGLPASGRN